MLLEFLTVWLVPLLCTTPPDSRSIIFYEETLRLAQNNRYR